MKFWYYTIPVVRGIFTKLCASTIVQQELQTVQFHGFDHGLCQDFSLCMQKVIAGHQSHHGSKLIFSQSILCSIFPTQLACQTDKVSDIGSLEVPHLWVVLEGFLHINEILGSKCAWRENVPPKHPIASLLLVSPLGDVQQSLGLIQTNIHQTKKIKKNSSHHYHHITWNHLATSRTTKHLARALRLHRP